MITTVWPANKEGLPGGDWRQEKRWLVLDVTKGIGQAVILEGPVCRWEALRVEMQYRTGARGR